ncbi:serine hydrolase domain-containing protein [Streptomyces goshikiensis]|uniref:serine hydrolase domain-containing protein n=1 Tax=Streptomyces goshikiensis TaxID=1942 RepID=UPI00366091D0
MSELTRPASAPDGGDGHGAGETGPQPRTSSAPDVSHPEPATPRPGRRRWLRRATIALPVALAVLVAGSYATTAVLDVQPPHTLLRLATTPFSEQGELFPSRTIPAASRPLPLPQQARAALPAQVPWKGGTLPVEEFLATTHTNAFLVLHDGKLAHQWYREGAGPTTRMASWSVAKSMVSLLAGQAIEAGKLSEDDRLVDVLPQLRTGGRYDEITVRHLLDMTAGVDVPEDYAGNFLAGTARMYLTRDLPGFIEDHRGLEFRPGSEGGYRSVDTELLGMVVAKAEGRPLADLFADNIWEPVGAQDTAAWNLDREGGTEKAFCCLNATARDYAKIGQLVLDGGRVNGRQVIPKAWIARISTPAPHKVNKWGYSAQWWHAIGGDGTDFSAIGIHGQYIYVNPDTRTVVVKLSDHGAEQDERETIQAMSAIAHSL